MASSSQAHSLIPSSVRVDFISLLLSSSDAPLDVAFPASFLASYLWIPYHFTGTLPSVIQSNTVTGFNVYGFHITSLLLSSLDAPFDVACACFHSCESSLASNHVIGTLPCCMRFLDVNGVMAI